MISEVSLCKVRDHRVGRIPSWSSPNRSKSDWDEMETRLCDRTDWLESIAKIRIHVVGPLGHPDIGTGRSDERKDHFLSSPWPRGHYTIFVSRQKIRSSIEEVLNDLLLSRLAIIGVHRRARPEGWRRLV